MFWILCAWETPENKFVVTYFPVPIFQGILASLFSFYCLLFQYSGSIFCWQSLTDEKDVMVCAM